MSAIPVPQQLSTDFPTTVWAAQQPLWRVHRQCHDSAHFATDQGGRFNPAEPAKGFGTWYLSTHRAGAFVEVFGRFGRVITRALIDERVLAQVWLPSDVRLADLTHPTVLGRYGITNELSTGGESIYPLAQKWATALWVAGFSGIQYLSRHDVTLQTRSIALFAKPADQPTFEAYARTQSLDETAAEMADLYGFTITAGNPL